MNEASITISDLDSVPYDFDLQRVFDNLIDEVIYFLWLEDKPAFIGIGSFRASMAAKTITLNV